MSHSKHRITYSDKEKKSFSDIFLKECGHAENHERQRNRKRKCLEDGNSNLAVGLAPGAVTADVGTRPAAGAADVADGQVSTS